MSDWKVIIETRGPLIFSETKPGGIYQNSLGYVPGTALRGSLAARWLEHQTHEMEGEHPGDCEFCAVFLDAATAAIFGNAYPAQQGDEEVRVLPATAMSCKNHSGFPESEKDDEHHGVFDTLLERTAWERLEPAGVFYSPTCPVCRERIEAFSGYYVKQGDRYRPRSVEQRLLTRVAINRRRMVAEEGLLYSPYVLSETMKQDQKGEDGIPRYAPTRFVGQVRNLPDGWKARLEAVDGAGGRNSSGLGWVHLWLEPLEEGNDLTERLRQFNEHLARVWQVFYGLGAPPDAPAQPDGLYFSLDLQADAVLRTADGLPAMVYDAEMLKADTSLEAELVRSYASYRYGGGWNTAWGLPKPAHVVTRMGSVYLFRVADDLGYAALANALRPLEQRGIGELWTEGYGQLRICDEFHLVRRGPNANNRD